MKVGIIGAGAWGTALALVSVRGGWDVILWSYDGIIHQYDDIPTPEQLHTTTNMSDLSQCETWLVVTPAAYFRDTLITARAFYKNQPVIICTKGAEPQTGVFMSDVLRETLPECKEYGVLSGPQFATEVARGVPTGSTLAGTIKARNAGIEILNQLYISQSDDIIGTELCGVGKNAVALICGYETVKSGGENERALIFTTAWQEIVSLGRAMGAKTETFLSLCGIGDLFLTATSPTSRNFSAGMSIAKGEDLTGTIEGISALNGIIQRANHAGIETPTLCKMKLEMKL